MFHHALAFRRVRNFFGRGAQLWFAGCCLQGRGNTGDSGDGANTIYVKPGDPLELAYGNSLQHNGLALASVLAWVSGWLLMSADLGHTLKFSFKDRMTSVMIKIPYLIIITALFWIISDKIWNGGNSNAEIWLKLIILGLAGMILYSGLAYLWNIPEPRRLLNILKKIF